jgi:hypothetical protein
VKIQDNKVSLDLNCDACRECVKVARPEGVLEIVGDDTKFIFNVESISGLRPEDVVLQAVDILKSKVKEFGKEVGKIK